jgi:hypothetical protein
MTVQSLNGFLESHWNLFEKGISQVCVPVRVVCVFVYVFVFVFVCQWVGSCIYLQAVVLEVVRTQV